MIKTHSYRGISWIDLESPDENEISSIVKKYNLHPLVGEELRSSPSQAKIDIHKEYVFVVLTVPVRTQKHGTHIMVDREIDFVIGKDFLITCRDQGVDQLEYFSKIFEANEILGKEDNIQHAGHIFYFMVKKIYTGMHNDLDNIRDAVISAERRIFKGEERNMVRVLSYLNRELIDFKQTCRIHHDIWDDFKKDAGKSIFDMDFENYVDDIKNDSAHVHESIVNARELLSDLRETNDSLLNTKQNEIMKLLTLTAFIFSPLTFIASIFTIPARNIPLIEEPYGWLIIMIGMAILTFGVWIFFKKKRWV